MFQDILHHIESNEARQFLSAVTDHRVIRCVLAFFEQHVDGSYKIHLAYNNTADSGPDELVGCAIESNGIILTVGHEGSMAEMRQDLTRGAPLRESHPQ